MPRQTCFEISGGFVSPARSGSESCEVLHMLLVVTTSDEPIAQAVKARMKCCCMRPLFNLFFLVFMLPCQTQQVFLKIWKADMGILALLSKWHAELSVS